MKKKDCNLVRDLLPNYIENLTNNDTNLFIENHLKECSECTDILNSMKSGENENEKTNSKKFVKFSKKFRKKYKILKYIVLLILFIIIFHTARNCFIYLSIAKKRNESIFSKTNYHYQMYVYSKGHLFSEEWYVKDGRHLYTYSSCSLEDNSFNNAKYYQYYDGQNIYSYDVDKKFFTVTPPNDNSILKPYIMDSINKINFTPAELLVCFLSKYDSCRINEIDCYRFTEPSKFNHDFFACYNKSTGMPIKSSNVSSGSQVDVYHYIDFDVVTDDDLILPNVDEYKPYDEVKDKFMLEDLNSAIQSNDLELIKLDLKAMLDEKIEIPSEYYEKYKYLLEE